MFHENPSILGGGGVNSISRSVAPLALKLKQLLLIASDFNETFESRSSVEYFEIHTVPAIFISTVKA